MDEIVRQAMARWPNVPYCFGWLGLDARGNWYMRDGQAQREGPFPLSKGSLLQHDKLIHFIERNYEADAAGQWYFQNGPQRVYVELENTPWVWRVGPGASVNSHTGQSVEVRRTLLDEQGYLYLETNLGLGLVHTLDVLSASQLVELGVWTPESVSRETLPALFGFVRNPAGQRLPVD